MHLQFARGGSWSASGFPQRRDSKCGSSRDVQLFSITKMRILALLIPVLAAMLVNPLAAATPGESDQVVLAARWQSDSLRDNRIGYHFDLAPIAASPTMYRGAFRFTHRDGRRVTFVATGGSFDKSSGPLRGVLNASRTTLTLTNCQARLSLVMSFDLDSDCVFRPWVIDDPQNG